MRDDADRLRDILDAIHSIATYASVSSGEPIMRQMAMDAILHRLLIIGESARTMSPAVISASPHIPWRQVAGLRNRVAHEYFQLDIDIVRTVVTSSLAELHVAVSALLGE